MHIETKCSYLPRRLLLAAGFAVGLSGSLAAASPQDAGSTRIPDGTYQFQSSEQTPGTRVVYEYRSPSTGVLSLMISGDGPRHGRLSVFADRDLSRPVPTLLAARDVRGNSAVGISVTAGTKYYMAIDRDSAEPASDWVFRLNLPDAVTVANRFNIASEAEFIAWKNAVRAAEYVREDYIVGSVPTECAQPGGTVSEASTPGTKPRVIGVLAAAMAFLDRNPAATSLQLEVFVQSFNAALATTAPGDADLARRANLLRALRTTRLAPSPSNTPELLGTDTDLGEAIMTLLNLEIARPLDFFTLQDRTALYERASLIEIAQGPEVGLLLAHAFLGHGPDGYPVEADISGVMQGFLLGEGYDPRLGALRPELCGVNTGMATLPADYQAYRDAIALGIDQDSVAGEGNPFQREIGLAFSENLAIASGIVNEISSTPQRNLLDAIAASQEERDAAETTLRNHIRSLAASRTAMFSNTIAMAQGVSFDAGNFDYIRAQTQAASSAQDISTELAYAQQSLTIASGLLAVAGGSPMVGISAITSGAFGIAGASNNVTNNQISDQITMLSQQIGQVQDQLNDRFDRVDARLAALITLSANGFTYLGNQIAILGQQIDIVQADLDAVIATLDGIAFNLWVQSTSLRRIEDALFGVANDLLSQNFIEAVFNVINFRAFEITDLPYSGPAPSFRSGANTIFQYATIDAAASSFSGSRTSPFPLAQADSYLGVTPIARVLNDLAVNSTAYGVPALSTQTIVAPEPWGQALTGYIELCRENPWYFAYLLNAEQSTPGVTPQISRMIADGDAMVSLGQAARNPDLFNNLVADYKSRTAALQSAVDALVREKLRTATPIPLGTSDGGVLLDLWMDVSTPEGVQDVAPFANGITGMTGPSTLGITDVLGDEGFAIATGLNWANTAQLRSLLLAFENNGNYRGISWSTVNSFADDIIIRLAEPRLPASTNDGVRAVRFSIYEAPPNSGNYQFSNTYANNPNGAIQLFWNELRFQFSLGSEIFVGASWEVGSSNQTRYQFRVISDSLNSRDSGDNYVQDKPALLADINQMLFRIRNNLIRPAVLSAIGSPTGSPLEINVYNAAQALNDSQAVLGAYANLALPNEIDLSSVLQSAFRGNAAISDLGLRSDSLPALIDSMSAQDASNASDAGDRHFDVHSIEEILNARVDAVNAEIQGFLGTTSPAASGYVQWILGEARDLRSNAARLAVDDTFTADSPQESRNVLANDTRQNSGPLLIGNTLEIEIDPTFGPGQPGFLSPTQGNVLLSADGDFTFTLFNPDFSGTQVFSYRARCNISGDPANPVWAVSTPAHVVFEVIPSDCPADINVDGVLNFFDVSQFITQFGLSNPSADFDADGVLTFFDVSLYLQLYSAGCP